VLETNQGCFVPRGKKQGTGASMNTRELLAAYADLLNAHGVDSEEAKEFLEANRFQEEFYDLAVLSKKLKAALTSPVCEQACNN
jgi:hypothetical protein